MGPDPRKVAALCVVSAGTGQAATFVLTDTGGAAVGTQARAGFDIAAAYWASVLKDNVTINLNVGFSALGTGILGQTGSARSLLSMNQAYTALNNDRTSALDNLAVASLRPLGTSTSVTGAGAVSAITNNFANRTNATNGYTDLSTRIDNDGSVNNSTVAVTKASAKALGATVDVNGNAITNTGADGSITFSNLFSFDFNPTDGIEANSFDFIGVAIHEIGHALGFVSGVDSYDARTSPGQTTAGNLTSLEDFVVMSQLDLFRYSSAGNLDWSTQNVPYFSIDGGATQLFGDSRFSTGTLNGDGRQASHWKDSAAGVPQLGILDPTSGRGQMQEITALDLAAFDAIGWNVSFDVLANSGYRYSTADAYRAFAVAVPEPATWGMMILGFGMIGGAARRRNTKVSFA
jgi:hypothetical protein